MTETLVVIVAGAITIFVAVFAVDGMARTNAGTIDDDWRDRNDS